MLLDVPSMFGFEWFPWWADSSGRGAAGGSSHSSSAGTIFTFRCPDNRGLADDYAEICWSCSSWRELLLKVRYFVTEAQSPEVIEIGLDHRISTSQIMTRHSSDSSDSSDSLLLQALHLKLMSWGLNTIREVCARLTALQWCDADKCDAVDATRSINILTEEESWPQAVFSGVVVCYAMWSNFTGIKSSVLYRLILEWMEAYRSLWLSEAQEQRPVSLQWLFLPQSLDLQSTVPGVFLSSCSPHIVRHILGLGICSTKVSPWQLAPQSVKMNNSMTKWFATLRCEGPVGPAPQVRSLINTYRELDTQPITGWSSIWLNCSSSAADSSWVPEDFKVAK